VLFLSAIPFFAAVGEASATVPVSLCSCLRSRLGFDLYLRFQYLRQGSSFLPNNFSLPCILPAPVRLGSADFPAARSLGVCPAGFDFHWFSPSHQERSTPPGIFISSLDSVRQPQADLFFFLLCLRPRQRSALRLFSCSADPPPATSVWLIFLHARWISSARVCFHERGSSLRCSSHAGIRVLRFSSPTETARPVKFQLCIFVS
jgi:hypothetical protein